MMLSVIKLSRGYRDAYLWRSYTEISKYFCSGALTGSSISPRQATCQRTRSSFLSLRCFASASRSSILDKPPTLVEAEFLQSFKDSIKFPTATHEIKGLSLAEAGSEIVLHGYIGQVHNLQKNLSFGQLLSKDLRHVVQLVSARQDSEKALETLRSLNTQTPVAIRGILKERPAEQRSSSLTKKILNTEYWADPSREITLLDVTILNEFPKDIIVTAETVFPPEQRHLQLRTDTSLRDALTFRAEATNFCRNELNQKGFLEIETPILFKSTPEGAREFLVPTRTKGLAYALPQSPQQYKQILMGSGISRYFQIARCFRDEDLRADRQPEFTQLDLEMAFATGEDVMVCMEELLRALWEALLQVKLPAPFPRMAYQDAMSKYGVDKPDTRLGMEITRVDNILLPDLIAKISDLPSPAVDILKFSVSDDPTETRDFITRFMDSPDATPFKSNPDGEPGIFVFNARMPLQGLSAFGFETADSIAELLDLEDGDLIVLQARENVRFTGGSTALGNLRLALHRAAVAQGLIEKPKGFNFLWITDFPLFTPSNDTDPGQGGAAGFSSTHHPFTSPKTPADVDLLATNPSCVVADHYDIVVNGVELGGGSRRIHSASVQEYILQGVLQMSEARVEDFRHLLEVLKAGCPPHAGIALGFDRLIAVMLGRESVRDVIAFPKSGKGEDLLVKAPNAITDEQLETYHLRFNES